MINPHTAPLLLTLPVSFAAGLGVGFAYFRALRATADLIVCGGRPILGLALTLGRLLGLGAVFYVAVLGGGLALLVALAGVLCARGMTLHKMRWASP